MFHAIAGDWAKVGPVVACLQTLHRYLRVRYLRYLGDWAKVVASLQAAGEPCTLRGVRSLLERCVTALRPVYISASTPHDFEYPGPSTGEDLP